MKRAITLLALMFGLFCIAPQCYATTNVTQWHAPSIAGSPYDYWNNGVNVALRDNLYSDINLVPSWAQWHNAESFTSFASFDIPSTATISAIHIKVAGYAVGSGVHNIGFYLTRDHMATYQVNSAGNDLLWTSVPPTVTDHTYTTNNTSAQFNNYGWTGADFNNPDFGVTMYADENTQNHFYVDFVWVQVEYITAGVSARVCDAWDIPCQITSWFEYWFTIDPTFAQDTFTSLNAIALTKFPIVYLNALQYSDFGADLGTAGAIPAFYMSFNPQLIHNGSASAISAVTINIPASTFAPVQPFVNIVRGIFSVVLWLSFAWFVVTSVRKLFI